MIHGGIWLESPPPPELLRQKKESSRGCFCGFFCATVGESGTAAENFRFKAAKEVIVLAVVAGTLPPLLVISSLSVRSFTCNNDLIQMTLLLGAPEQCFVSRDQQRFEAPLLWIMVSLSYKTIVCNSKRYVFFIDPWFFLKYIR
jgi:hypothetical protein